MCVCVCADASSFFLTALNLISFTPDICKVEFIWMSSDHNVA